MNMIRILAPEHPITSVTVLKSSKAEVSRTFEISLKYVPITGDGFLTVSDAYFMLQEGRNKVILTKLPTTIDEQPAQISLLNLDGTPSESTHLSDTVCSVADNSRDDPARIILRSLEIQKSGLQSEKEMLDTQAKVLVAYARSLTGQIASIKDVDTFLDAFTERGRKNIEAAMKIEEQTAEVDNHIQEEKRERAQVKGSVNTEICLVITACGEARLRLLLVIVNNTKWTPTYEFHVITGEDGKPSRNVSFHYHALVKQTTEEDWTDALLTLSTVTIDSRIKNDSEYRLLPGPVSIILDNKYVSSTRLSVVSNSMDISTFTLGDDPSIIISYECFSDVTQEGIHTLAEPIDITTYTKTINIHNTHPFPVENLVIRDAVRVSGSDKHIEVLLRKPQELVEAEEGEFAEVSDSEDKLLVRWEREKDGLYEYK
ncbi:hypothetical protein AN958_12684 [Leucoagaricus sp. SymC.cos]|nr:hypothetical protein AN958_12684 [Leucoagaricus sp. SymC.cos]